LEEGAEDPGSGGLFAEDEGWTGGGREGVGGADEGEAWGMGGGKGG
jgi:hypothetical protein